jgi:hypothetical protein
VDLTISVVRSGGFAGMRRAWDVHLDDSAGDADSWRALIEDCPWDAAPGGPSTPDRFVYRITVNDRSVTVPESALGPWRALTDRVRETAERRRQDPLAE